MKTNIKNKKVLKLLEDVGLKQNPVQTKKLEDLDLDNFSDEDEKTLRQEENLLQLEIESLVERSKSLKVIDDSNIIEDEVSEEKRQYDENLASVRNKIERPFSLGRDVDTTSMREAAANNVLPKSLIPKQTSYPEPFEEEPALNKELSEFKQKINEHMRKMGFASSGGGGEVRLEFLDDIDRDTAKVNNKFLKYQSSSGKWIGAEAGTAATVTVTDNESTNEHNAIVFVADADLDGGDVELESDGDLKYNPNSGTVTATTFSGALSGNATTATEATNITAAANNSTDETVYPTFVDGATGTQGLETDTGLTYNPSTGTVTSTTFSGALSGNATTTTALATGRTIGMTGDVVWTSASFDGSGNVTGSATIQANSVDGTMIALGSDASGDVMYYNGTNYVRLAKGSDDEVLTLASGLPSWAAASSGVSLSGSTNNTVATVTGSNALAGEGNLTFDGSTLAVTGAITGTTDLTLGDDLVLDSDAAVIQFGDDQEIKLTHLHNQGLEITSTHDAPLVRRGEDIFIVLNGTNSSAANAGDNLILDASAAGVDVGDDIIGEDEVFIHTGMQRDVLNIKGSDGKLKKSIAGFSAGSI
jgi:hypothetical protein